MSSPINRRDFVSRTLTAGVAAGLADFAFLRGLGPVQADEAKLSHDKVRFSAETEPLVRLIEDTDRPKLLEAVAGQIRKGTSYQQILTGLLLAGVRSIKPRPVGFKFHAVLVVNSAHLASLAAPEHDRWLPLFWALDNFKGSQAKNAEEGGWVMPPADEARLPTATQAKKRFAEAMDNWDEEGADRAVTAWARTAGENEIMETFLRYGARDFRDIGHKAIYVANSWRTLQTIGWRHAEPVLRSLAFALLEHGGRNPAQFPTDADRPGRENLKRAAGIRKGWQQGKVTAGATTDLLATLRGASPSEACDAVVALLNKEAAPASLWDALFLRAGELLMQQPGIVGIHCVTSTNALHFGYQASGNDETRQLLLLQAAAFLTMFRGAMQGRGKLREDLHIDKIEKADVANTGAGAIEEILTDVSKDRMTAARKTLALLQTKGIDPHQLMTAARRLVFNKGTDAHDYKFSSAALEDYYHATPAWRDRYLATSMFNLRGALDHDNDLVKRTRAALGA
ncbi:MAG TPA: hypothetical protein VG013_38180 [Gemmataceae bacterium]|jgi:hypothetical protein|nr:hypothetical protein [Gemmataceae bacterium]